MSLPATDNFNRANEDPIAGSWTEMLFDTLVHMVLQSNGVFCNGTDDYAFAIWNADTPASDQYSQAVLHEGGTGGRRWLVNVRMTGSGGTVTGYALAQSTANLYLLFSIAGGVATQIASVSHNVGDGHTMKVTVVGTTLTMYDNGSQVSTPVTDSSYATGVFGLGMLGGTVASSYLDDWEGGNMVTVPPPAVSNAIRKLTGSATRPAPFKPGLAR